MGRDFEHVSHAEDKIKLKGLQKSSFFFFLISELQKFSSHFHGQTLSV